MRGKPHDLSRPSVGERVSYRRGETVQSGYVIRVYDYHGAKKVRVRNNGAVHGVLASDLLEPAQ